MTDLAPWPPFDGTEPCVQKPDLFDTATGGLQRTEEAKAACNSCHVTGQCLSYALDHHEHGIWGATTDAERDEIRSGSRWPAPPPVLIRGPQTIRDRITALDDGTRSARQIAALAGCSKRTVERLRSQRRRDTTTQEGQAA